MSNVYILIEWPDSQEYMEEEWFEEEAILATPHEDGSLSSAYFIPKNRYDNMTKLSFEDWYDLNEE